MGHYPAAKKNEVLMYVTPRVHPENIMPLCQLEEDTKGRA